MTDHALSLQPSSDYRFTYMGPTGTFTPLHRDVYGSYSWSSNIVGRKRWWLIPPHLTSRFRKRNDGDDATEDGGGHADIEMVFDLRSLSPIKLEGVIIVEQEVSHK